jgi:hypothetical protein
MGDIPSYPGPVTLYPSWKKWAALLGICAVVTLFGVGMVADDPTQGWFVAAVGAAFTVLAVIPFLPGAASVTLGPQDFETVWRFRHAHFRWQNVSTFEIWAFHESRFVVFADPTKTGARHFRAKMITQRYNCSLPDTYGLTPEAFAELMNGWRQEALAAQSRQSMGTSIRAARVDSGPAE